MLFNGVLFGAQTLAFASRCVGPLMLFASFWQAVALPLNTSLRDVIRPVSERTPAIAGTGIFPSKPSPLDRLNQVSAFMTAFGRTAMGYLRLNERLEQLS